MAEFRGCSACYAFEQVATKTQVRAEDYLRMTFEHDAEFVHGDIVERPLPDYTHARIQCLVTFEFGKAAQVHALYPYPGLRLKVAPDVYRIPDLTVFALSPPREAVPEKLPLVVIEIVSKDERYSALMLKLEEYRQWGIPNIWVIDPPHRPVRRLQRTRTAKRLFLEPRRLFLPTDSR